jgi:F0F1-type ATP synthase delta subunit
VKESRITLAEIILKLSKKTSSKKLAKEIAAYMLSQKRTKEIDALLRDIWSMEADRGTIEGMVEITNTKDKVPESEIKKVIKKLRPEAKEIIINYLENPDLIGGVKISLPHQQLDTSIRSKLDKFKRLTTQGIN